MVKEFFRYHISGNICIFWAIVFLTPYFDYQYLAQLFTDGKIEIFKTIIAIVTALMAASYPIGIFIHEISMTFCSVPCATKIAQRSWIRKPTEWCCKKLAHGDCCSDAIHTVSKSVTSKDAYDIPYIREQISHLYAYCYLRINTGVFAPILGFLIAFIVMQFSSVVKSELGKELGGFFLKGYGAPLFPLCYLLVCAFLVFLLLELYLPRMLLEITYLENFLLENSNLPESVKQTLTAQPNTAKPPPHHLHTSEAPVNQNLSLSFEGKDARVHLSVSPVRTAAAVSDDSGQSKTEEGAII